MHSSHVNTSLELDCQSRHIQSGRSYSEKRDQIPVCRLSCAGLLYLPQYKTQSQAGRYSRPDPAKRVVIELSTIELGPARQTHVLVTSLVSISPLGCALAGSSCGVQQRWRQRQRLGKKWQGFARFHEEVKNSITNSLRPTFPLTALHEHYAGDLASRLLVPCARTWLFFPGTRLSTPLALVGNNQFNAAILTCPPRRAITPATLT